MANVTPEEFQEKHARRLKAAVEDIRKGVDRMTVSPGEKAIQKKDKMQARFNEAMDSGKWEANLRKVTLEDWREKMKTVGISRIATGIDGAAAKVRDFAAKLLPHIDAGKAKIMRMPDVTLEDSIARSSAFIRHMSEFTNK